MSTRVPAIERRADEEVMKWVHSQKAPEGTSSVKSNRPLGPYLTLSREAGAGGSELARNVAERLQWDVLDNEIVEYMEQHYGTPRCLIQRVDEKHESWLSEILTSRIGGLGFSESTYTHRVAKLVLLAASHGNVVIVGRGAKFILPRDRGLAVRVVAPFDVRVHRVMIQRSISEKEAHRWIVEKDRQRKTYIREHFHQDDTDPHLYDLVLNIGESSLDEAADVIVDAVRRWSVKLER